jgi:hypothetical protein
LSAAKLNIGTTMKHYIERALFIFKYYILIFVVVILLLIAAALFPPHLEWQAFAAIAAVVVSLAFGVQKQNLERTELFKKLFEQFNKRYDDMNDDMNRIYRDSESSLTGPVIKTLYKYFNLCGEEYLYYRKGFIYEEVWRAWNNGMKFFLKNPRIKRLWDEELKDNDSYYGLKF